MQLNTQIYAPINRNLSISDFLRLHQGLIKNILLFGYLLHSSCVRYHYPI